MQQIETAAAMSSEMVGEYTMWSREISKKRIRASIKCSQYSSNSDVCKGQYQNGSSLWYGPSRKQEPYQNNGPNPGPGRFIKLDSGMYISIYSCLYHWTKPNHYNTDVLFKGRIAHSVQRQVIYCPLGLRTGCLLLVRSIQASSFNFVVSYYPMELIITKLIWNNRKVVCFLSPPTQ